MHGAADRPASHSREGPTISTLDALTTPEDLRARLQAAGTGTDDALDLAETALLLAALDRPDGLEAARHHVDELVARAAALAPRALDPGAQAALLAHVLYEEAGYEGDRERYDHPDNANLIRVIERRRGLPVALGLLYIHLGNALGWPVDGLALPGHFVVRVGPESGGIVIDPFNGGAALEPPALTALVRRALGADAVLAPAHLARVSRRDVLLRLLNNLRSRAASEGRQPRVAEILARMTLIAPAQADLWYERGLAEGDLGHLSAAGDALARAQALAGDSALGRHAAIALGSLRRRLN